MERPRKQNFARNADSAVWLRARRPEHKQARRADILEASRRLLDAHGVEGTTLSAIGREAGLSKANCYRYFESREAILLDVVLDEARGWTDEVERGLNARPACNDVDVVVEVFVRATVERPRLCMLISSLWSVIERNVSAESVAGFKRSFIEQASISTDAVKIALPSIGIDDANAFFNFFFFFVAGLWPAANPPPVVAEVLSRDEFANHGIDFESTLRIHAQTVLRGRFPGAGGEMVNSTTHRRNTCTPD